MKSLHFLPHIILLSIVIAGPASDAGCLAPQRPFVPNNPIAAAQYAELIRTDFENYIGDVQAYFRYLDAERVRVFEEAHEVSQEYGVFLKSLRQE